MTIEKVCRAHYLADFFISLSHKPKFHDMKRPFITSLFLILALTSMAQASKNYITPDWKHIEQLCTSRPDSIRLLVERVATPTPEQPPTMAECVLAYCGQSYISLGKETVNEQEMNKALQNKETAKAIQLADKVLAVNPLNLSALLVKAQLCRDGWPFATDTPVPKNTGYGALLVFQRLLEAIAATGDGSHAHPFVVTSVPDEYHLLREYLGIQRVKGQALVGHCDVLTLGGVSERYDKSTIHFDITREMELLTLLFKGK